MFDPAQIILLVVVITLTILLVVLGIQVYLMLKDLRKTLDKANKVLDNTEEITGSVSAPINSISSVLMGLKAGGALASLIKKFSDSSKEDKNG